MSGAGIKEWLWKYKNYFLTAMGICLLTLFWIKTKDELSWSFSVPWGVVLTVLLLNLGVLILKTLRWKIILMQLEESRSFLFLFRMISSGFFLALVTPATLGDFGRSLGSKIELSKTTASVFYEKFFDSCTLLFILGASIIGIFYSPRYAYLFLIAISLLFIGIVSYYPFSTNASEKNTFFHQNARHLKNICVNKKVNLITYLISILLWGITLTQFYLLFQALGIKMSFFTTLAVTFGSYLFGVITLVPFGMGTIDYFLYKISTLVNVSSSSMLQMTYSFRLMITLPLLIVGFTFYLSMVWGGESSN